MTPATYLKLARDIAIGLALAFIVWRIYTDGRNADVRDDMKRLQATITQQAQTLAQWQKEATDANTKLGEDLAALHAAADIPKPPVWLCNQSIPASRGAVLPATPKPSSAKLPDTGGVLEGSRRDIRPQLEALKLKYEEQFALCRAEHEQWPQ